MTEEKKEVIIPIPEGLTMSCQCQGCGNQFKVDLIVPDNIWEEIKPEGKPEGAGLLCGSCIMSRIEKRGNYDHFCLDK